MFMTHDIFPFVNVFVVTNILTRNYHEFYFILKFVAFYYTIYLAKIDENIQNFGLIEIKK